MLRAAAMAVALGASRVVRRSCWPQRLALLLAGAPLLLGHAQPRARPRLPWPISPRACRTRVVNISTTQTLKGSKEDTARGPGPERLALRGVLQRLLRRSGQGRPAAQGELARLRLRHRSFRSDRHQQSRHRGRRRDHHQLHQRHQAEGGQDPRPRSEDRSRAAQGRAQGAAQGRELRRFLQDAGGRLGDGDRQSLRPRRHRHGRHHLGQEARHQCRPL